MAKKKEVDKVKEITKYKDILGELLENTHCDRHETYIAVSIKCHNWKDWHLIGQDDIPDLCKELKIPKKYWESVKEYFPDEYIWELLGIEVDNYKDFLVDEYELDKKEIWCFGRSGGWLSLAKKEDIEDAFYAAEDFLDNIGDYYADILGDEEQREDALLLIDGVYDEVARKHYSNVLKALKDTEQSVKSFSMKQLVLEEIKWRYENEEFESSIPKRIKKVA